MTEFRLATPNDRSKLYPRFGDEEYEDRWDRVRATMDEQGYDAVVIYGNAGFESIFVNYLTNYRPTYASYLVAFADPDEEPTLYVGISNHLQYVREVSVIDDLDLMLHDTPKKLADRLTEGGADDGTIGIVGVDPRYDNGMPYPHYEYLDSHLEADLENATVPFTTLTAVKSDAEIERITRAAATLDDAMAALGEDAEPGMSEADLRSIVSSTMAAGDCGVGIDFMSTAPMEGAQPGEPLPWKDAPADRSIEVGDVVTTEISASYRGYASQIHRPYAVGTAPTERYRDLFAVAKEAYDGMVDALRPGNTVSDVHEATAPVEESEYKIYDVFLHGYGNGYQHPFVGTSDSNYWPGADDAVTADWEFEENQVLVVQPNVFTRDERCGLQLGTTVVVRENGPEVIHDYPVEFGEI